MTEVFEEERNWRAKSLLSNSISSFDLSNKLGSIFASHFDSSSSEKKFKLSAIFFVTSIQFVACALQENLSYQYRGVQIPRDICIRFGCYLYSTKCSWIINTYISCRSQPALLVLLKLKVALLHSLIIHLVKSRKITIPSKGGLETVLTLIDFDDVTSLLR